MTFESVRLTHAQAVANHYITNQIYIPTDEDHQSRGSFLILLDSIGAKDGSFTASLVNTLIREYYRSPDADRLAVFEQSLVRVNNLLKSPTTRESDPHNLDGCIVLFANDEIHVTYIGTCHAFLHRQKQLIRLIDSSSDDTTSTGFSVITSGEIQDTDVLVMGTPESTEHQFQDDITFALKQEPLFETARALARLFKQHQQHASEAQFIRFSSDDATHEQIYLDKPLESSSEKMEHFQKQAKHHTELILSGVHFISQKALGITKRGTKAAAIASSEPVVPEPTYEEFMADDADMNNNTVTQLEELNEAEPLMTTAPAEVMAEKAELAEEAGDYAVKHYWEKDTATANEERIVSVEANPVAEPEEATKEPTAPTIQPRKPIISYDDGESEEIDLLPLATGSRFKPALPSFSLGRLFATKWWLNRYVYIGIALIALVIVGIRVSGSLRQQASTPQQSTSERDSLLALAENELRDSDSAQIQDDSSKAITHLLAAQTALAKISDTNKNEQSKSLSKQTIDSLTRLTSTTALTSQSTTEITDKADKVVSTAQGTYAFLANNTIMHIKDGTATLVPSIPTYEALIDAVAYDSLQRVAFAVTAGEATKLYTLATASNQIQEVTRADSKLWPETDILSSFSTNLYFVGPTMFKGTRTSDTVYRVSSYANGASTQSITSIITNGGIFYAVSNDRDIIRIAANSPITTVSLSGVPDVFLPKVFTQILTSQSEATLSFFDPDGQRLLVFSTDGAYRKQYTLPENSQFSTCDLNEKALVCASLDKKLVTFGL